MNSALEAVRRVQEEAAAAEEMKQFSPCECGLLCAGVVVVQRQAE